MSTPKAPSQPPRKRDRFARLLRRGPKPQPSPTPISHPPASPNPSTCTQDLTPSISTGNQDTHSSVAILEPVITSTPKHFWGDALQQLAPEDRSLLLKLVEQPPVNLYHTFEVLIQELEEKRKLCEAKRWTFSLGGHRYSIRKEAEKVVMWLDRFKQAGDVAVNADPVHAGLPWALFRILLQTAVSDHEQLGAVMLGIERVSYVLSRCKIYVELYFKVRQQETDAVRINLEEALTKLHVILLGFIVKALQVMNKSTIGRITNAFWRPEDIISFTNDCSAVEDHLQGAVDGFERILSIRRHQDTLDGFQKLEQVLKDLSVLNDSISCVISTLTDVWDVLSKERRGEVLHWTSSIPHEDHHTMAATGRTSGTAAWIYDRTEFKDWESSSSSKLLWLHGIPGAGKTKIVSRVVDDLRHSRDNQTRLAYFYCSQNEDQRRKAVDILRSIVKQLAVAPSNKIHRELIDIYERKELSGFASAYLSLEETQQILYQTVSSFDETIIVLDALDECYEQDRSTLITAFEKVLKSPPRVRIMISSRRNIDIERQLKKESNVGIEATDNKNDIRTFLKAKIEEDTQRRMRLGINIIPSKLTHRIENTIFRGSEGMFQWASLQIAQLLSLERMADIQDRLGVLPVGLTKTYDELLAKIKSQDGSKPEIAMHTLQSIWASVVPLKIDAILALACQNPDKEGISTVDIDTAYILDSCQNLVLIDSGGISSFSHSSVHDYLQTHRLELGDSHSFITSIYLKMLLSSTSVEMTPPFEALLAAASESWHHQARAADREWKDQSSAYTYLKKFLGAPKEPALAYSRWLTKEREEWDPEEWGTLEPGYPELAACYFGFTTLIQDWINTKKLDINQTNAFGFPLLHFAIATQDEGTFNILLENGANGDSPFPLWAALQVAIRKDDLTYLRVLLERGADPNIGTKDIPALKGNPSYTSDRPFSYTACLLGTAIRCNHKDTVAMLLEHGADVDVELFSSIEERGPEHLVVYAMSRKPEIVKLLLDNPKALQILREDNNLSSSLQAARTWGNYKVIRIILDSAKDIPTKKFIPQAMEALRKPARTGDWISKEIFQAIASRCACGLDLDTNHIPSFALIYACCFRWDSIAEMLMGAGVDINAPCKSLKAGSWTPLVAAAIAGSESTVRLLCHEGVDVNHQTQLELEGMCVNNALAAAVHRKDMITGIDTIIRLLLDHGATPDEGFDQGMEKVMGSSRVIDDDISWRVGTCPDDDYVSDTLFDWEINVYDIDSECLQFESL
ncbi:ankyrin [Amniculicola lignicola CBS 123094]|uniref:Ankyrin n=1 Tax=Amniculicola lignicola CBS 123094 TaxID=1392246 RepID=A0A6A5W0E4_9PLEO|nr:ankyrin [Amniculicola lignicola CBS 123094]